LVMVNIVPYLIRTVRRAVGACHCRGNGGVELG
jgi:hypothetical protein